MFRTINMTVRETSRLWLFIGRFLLDPVVWRDGNIILGILNRTIHRPRSQHPMAVHYKLHRYTLVNTPERALYILSYERPAGVVETEAVFGAGRGGARAGRRRRREGAGRGRGRGRAAPGFGVDAGRGQVEDDDAVGFELLDLSQPNFNNLSQELLQLHLMDVSKDISLKGWLSVAISSGMETLQYEELKTQYEKTLRSCMIPSNSYLQYTLIRDGGNLEHLLTLSKNSQTLLCKIGTTDTEENLTVRQDLRWNKQVGTLLFEFGLAKQGHRSIGKCSLEKF
ncbi:hypothetical protein ISN45_At05g029790 [Arabidopsis thaliana x Arabidopsis arenosa]|uniref:Uncharacterized protein n=1 Tax=Arabidopsis thaliana x Arabidopsis arenosa TaxID=1240361 RepID=A0A8T2CZJ2_9BRAS|nr:hypothetical protein ISN45_At05g029790 [Arabidopsis thaliana x Arabidopsis arenosa]